MAKKPTRRPAPSAPPADVGEVVRVVMDITPETRKALKMRALDLGMTVKGYLLHLAKEDGAKVDGRDLG